MVFPSLQLALALSCVMGLVMFACYCGVDHSDKLSTSSRDAVGVSILFSLSLFSFFTREEFLWTQLPVDFHLPVFTLFGLTSCPRSKNGHQYMFASVEV